MVYSIFDDKISDADIKPAGKVETNPVKTTPDMVNPRLDNPVVLDNGKEMQVTEPVMSDILYDNDSAFMQEYSKLNDPKFLQEVNAEVVKIDPKEIELKIKEIEDTFKSDQASKGLEGVDTTPESVKLEVEKLKDYYTKNNPEQASEIAKAFDFCLRKNT
jgi:hypothetical protein